jgi:TrpR family trp operon transcriptional repressor
MRRADDIVRVLAGIRDPRTMRRFCDEIFTATERRDLGLRWELMRCLHAGVPQRRVAADLGISLCKITRGSRVLKKPGSVSKQLLDAAANTGATSGKGGTHE